MSNIIREKLIAVIIQSVFGHIVFNEKNKIFNIQFRLRFGLVNSINTI